MNETTVFFIAAISITLPTIAHIVFLFLQKHFGNWNDQLRLREHGIWAFVNYEHVKSSLVVWVVAVLLTILQR